VVSSQFAGLNSQAQGGKSMGSVINDIGGAISGGINAVENLASGNIGGAVSSGLGAVADGFLAANPEIGMASSLLGPLGGMLSSLTGQAGGGIGGANQSPSLFGNLSSILGGALSNPLGALGGLSGGGSTSGAGGLPNVGATQNSIQQQLGGLLNTQMQEAQFQIQFQELSSLISMLQQCGTSAAKAIA
jgi:hypothetical protein